MTGILSSRQFLSGHRRSRNHYSPFYLALYAGPLLLYLPNLSTYLMCRANPESYLPLLLLVWGFYQPKPVLYAVFPAQFLCPEVPRFRDPAADLPLGGRSA